MELIVKYENEIVKTCFKKKEKVVAKKKSKGYIDEVVRDRIYEHRNKFGKNPEQIKMSESTFAVLINETTTQVSLNMHDDGVMFLHGVKLYVV